MPTPRPRPPGPCECGCWRCDVGYHCGNQDTGCHYFIEGERMKMPLTVADMRRVVDQLQSGALPTHATYLGAIHPDWLTTPARRFRLWALLERLTVEAEDGELT